MRPVGILATLAFLLAACGSVAGGASAPPKSATSADTSGLDKLYQAAKAEGAVTWQGNIFAQGAQAISDAFDKRYPGVKATFNPINEPQAPAQILTEASSGNGRIVDLDIAHGSPTQFRPLLARDLLQDGDWTGTGVDPKDVLVDGKWIVNDDSVNTWVYNSSLVQANELPKTWDDLLTPRWKGKKIGTNANVEGFAHLFLALGEDKARQLLTGLKGQDVILTKSKGDIRLMLDSGQVQLGLTDMTLFLRDKQKGAPLERLALTPMAHDVRGWYMPKGALHPNAARLFAAWMVSPEGHALQQSAAGYELATPCSASPTAKYICDQKIDYIDFNTQKLDIMAYYEKLDSYIKMAADVLGVIPQ